MNNLQLKDATSMGNHDISKAKDNEQVPKDFTQAMQLDQINNNTLWKEAIDQELSLLKELEAFQTVDKGEIEQEKCVFLPHCFAYSIKFDQHRKAQLVLNNVTTAFLHDQGTPTDFLRDNGIPKVNIIAGPEFGKDEGKILTLKGGFYGLMYPAVNFQEQISVELKSKVLAPSQMDINNDNHHNKDIDNDNHHNVKDNHCHSITYVDDIMILEKNDHEI